MGGALLVREGMRGTWVAPRHLSEPYEGLYSNGLRRAQLPSSEQRMREEGRGGGGQPNGASQWGGASSESYEQNQNGSWRRDTGSRGARAGSLRRRRAVSFVQKGTLAKSKGTHADANTHRHSLNVVGRSALQSTGERAEKARQHQLQTRNTHSSWI